MYDVLMVKRAGRGSACVISAPGLSVRQVRAVTEGSASLIASLVPVAPHVSVVSASPTPVRVPTVLKVRSA